MCDKISSYISKRISTLQKLHNFHPTAGIRQIDGAPPEVRERYLIFRELLEIAKRLDLQVRLDAIGSDPKAMAPAKPQDYVYVHHKSGTNEYKIGHSSNPHQRGKSLNTGTSGTLILVTKVPGDYAFEQLVLRYLEPLRIPGRSKEWCYLDSTIVKTLRGMLKEGPAAFSGRYLLKNQVKK